MSKKLDHDAEEEAQRLQRQHGREVLELSIVDSTMSVVAKAVNSVLADVRAHNRILQQQNKRTESNIKLSDFEDFVFDRNSYREILHGVAAGAAVFGTLFGGMRYVSYRNALKRDILPGSASYRARIEARRRDYASLDRPTRKAPSKSTVFESKEAVTTASPMVPQLQFMLSSFVGMLVAVVYSNFVTDDEAFHRDLVAVPLQPGKSVLCSRMCPMLFEHRQYIASSDPMLIVTSILQEGMDPIEPQVHDIVSELKPEEVCSAPVTDELNSIEGLIENCRRRMEFEDECRKRQEFIDEDGTVDVPEEGVPLEFVRSNDATKR